jgi:hypothetical protein
MVIIWFVVAASELRVGIESAVVGGALGLVGGLISASFAAYFDRQRDRVRGALETKAASRLIDDELRNAHDAAVSIKGGEPYASLPTTAWVGERVRLAAAFTADDWDLVARAYDRIRGYNWRFEAGVLKDAKERNLICDKIVADVPQARDRLTKYVSP